MWSGPRNLSTAMMYAFASRSDFSVWDEPFYAPYLAVTGDAHPMASEILAAHETDPARVADRCLGPMKGKRPHCYMKHMPHHMLEDFPIAWADECINVHLIRHPARVIASYGAKRAAMTANDIGFRQQSALFDRIGGLVIDSADIRADPEQMLSLLCDAIGLEFDPAMLRWPAGPRSFDGIWAAHWYNAVHQSTGFAGPEGPLPSLTAKDAVLLEESMPYYEKLASEKI